MKGYPEEWPRVSLEVKCDAWWRCVRCNHPGAAWAARGELLAWPELDTMVAAKRAVASRMDLTASERRELFDVRTMYADPTRDVRWLVWPTHPCDHGCTHPDDGKRRQLTVHHLDGDPDNLAWWNLAALCQVCHLHVQGKVQMEQAYLWPHTGWFRPYVSGYYASVVLGEDVTREEAEARMDELLAAGQPHLYGE